METVKKYRKSKILVIAFFIFISSFLLRVWDLNSMGRVWDEQAIQEKGFLITKLLKEKDFSNKFWYIDAADHPIFAFYFIGLASYGDVIEFDKNAPTTFSPGSFGAPIFPYDLTYGRLLSAFISSLSVALIFLIGARYFSLFVGLSAAIILATIPHYLGYSKMVELESWIVLFFSACVFSYLLFLETGRRHYLILTGILTGLTLMIKQSNALIFIFYLLTFFAWWKLSEKRNITFFHFIPLGVVTLITAFIVYPMPWFHLTEFLGRNADWLEGGLVPELIFGRLMGARSFYYVLAFFITTPFLILILTLVGLKYSFDKRKLWIYSALIIWFFVPFLITFFHMRQHMVRYIIEFYAPLSILTAIGLEYIAIKFSTNKNIKYLAFIIISIYMMISIFKIHPYYLSYYNELVGGIKNVYNKNLFFIGWWGEGLVESGKYLEMYADRNKTIGLALNPTNTIYKSKDLKYEKFDPRKEYEYVVLNDFNITRLGFDERILDKDYVIVFREGLPGVDFSRVYKHK